MQRVAQAGRRRVVRPMADFAVPNRKPGRCEKCAGTGTYSWGGTINGAPRFVGKCWSCKGTGKQSRRDIRRNETYNRYKVI